VYQLTITNPGGVLGVQPAGEYAAGTPVDDQLVNPTNAVQTVIYHFKARIRDDRPGHGGFFCDQGGDTTITVYVQPTPRLSVSIADTVVCDSTTINITVDDLNGNVHQNTTKVYQLTITNPGGVLGVQADGEYPAGTDIDDQLINPTNAVQTVIYHFKARIRDDRPGHIGNFCDQGGDTTITVYVQPTPKLSVSIADTIVCDSTTINITVNDLNGNVHPATTKVYQLTITNPGGVLGVQPAGEYAAGTPVDDQLVNPTNAVQTVIYHFKARIRDDRPGHIGNFCDQGGDTLIVVYVEPTARVTGTISNDTICNINAITYTLASPNAPLYGIRFNVRVVNPYPEVSGYTTPRNNLTDASIITETLTNSGDTARMIMYIITPSTINHLGIQNCPGVNDTIFLWINPTPRATPINLVPEMCYGQSTRIELNSPTVMTKGIIRFNYTITTTDGDIVGNTAPMNDQPEGLQLVFPYQNNSDTIKSVYYHFIPTNNESGCVNGPLVDREVKVHPHPLQLMTAPTLYTCSGSVLGIMRVTLARGSKPNRIFWDRPSFIGDTIYYTSANKDSLALRYTGQYSVTVTDNFNCTRTSQTEDVTGAVFQTIFAVMPYPTGYGTMCPGDSTGHILLIEDYGSTASAPFEYWLIHNYTDTLRYGVIPFKGDPGMIHLYNLPAGQYNVSIRDANGCFNDVSNTQLYLPEPEPVTVTFETTKYAGFDVSCRGYSDGHVWIKTITGGNPGGYRYKWFTYDGTITGIDTLDRLDNITAGTYYLLTTDRYCTKLDSVTLIQGPGMDLASYNLHWTADSAYNISCFGGSDGSIDITVTGGAGPYTFQWTDSAAFAATTEDITGLKQGTYVVEVKDKNGCILKLLPGSLYPSFTLNEPAPLVITPVLSNSTAGGYNINCYAGTGSIDITVTGGSGPGTYVYNWTTSNGSGLVAGQEDQPSLTAGAYALEVTDLYGCKVSYDTLLTEPQALAATAVPKHITCAAPGFDNGEIDLTVTGGVAPYTYLWSNSATTEDITGLTEGEYTVTITDANGCQLVTSATVNNPPQLLFNYQLSNHNGYNISCYDGANGVIRISTRSGTAPFTYTWSSPSGFSSSLPEISGLPAGQYNMHIVDSNLCTADTTFILTQPGEFTVDLDPSMTAGGTNISCAGTETGSINANPVNAVGAVRYLWSDGGTSQLRQNLLAGTYEVIVTDANFCIARNSITLSEPDSLKLVFDVTQPWCTDKPNGEIRLTVSGGIMGTAYSYLWSDGSTGNNISDIASGWYSVKVTDLNNCQAVDSVFLKPQNEVCLVIPNAISPNGDLINDIWNIGEYELYPEIEIRIFDSWGNLVWQSEKGYPRKWDGTSRGRKLPIDSYHYVIDLHNGTRPIVGNVTIVR
jgi:gliding motility-associated-like protein